MPALNVVIVGAGVAGLATAWYLRKDGHDVTVLERRAGVARECSFANGGQLSYGYVAPLAGPGVLPRILPWLLRGEAPLRFRPALDPQQWLWCLRFLSACNSAQANLTTRRMLALSLYSRALLHDLIEQERFDFAHARSGKLVVHSDPASMSCARRQVAEQASRGCVHRALDVHECLALEPALGDVARRIVGGIYMPEEEVGDCRAFCEQLARRLEQSGVRILTGVEALRFVGYKRGIAGIETCEGIVEADRYILAAGASAPALAGTLRLRLPIYPLQGCSISVHIDDARKAPVVSVTDFERRVVFARLGNTLRVAGMADIVGRRLRAGGERIATLVRLARNSFPDCSDFRRVAPWFGQRPATPEGTPLLGPTRFPSLLLNAGHGMLGFTIALGCARIVADLATGRTPAVPTDGFAPRA